MKRGCIAGIDVHKKMLAVIIRREGDGGLEYTKRSFGTTRKETQHLLAWLEQLGVEEVVMESTAQYWRPVWLGLEGHFRLHLCHPLKVKAPRGRKRDFRDAQRLADRWSAGDLEESFIPAAEQQSWRDLTRARVHYQRRIAAVRNRVEVLLEQGGIKLTSVVSDPFGVSGWAMLKRIAAGESDVKAMVGEARGALKKKEEQLTEALAGQLRPSACLQLRQCMEQVQLLRQQISEINEALAVAMKDQLAVLVRLTKIPGVEMAAAQELLAEIGPAAATFPSAEQLASWVGVCPGSQESAGVCYSHRSAKGNRHLRRVLCQISWAAIRTKDTFFAGLFARLQPRIEAKGAAWAVAHRICKVVWLVLHQGAEYREHGPAVPNPRTLARRLRSLLRQIELAGLDPHTLIPTLSPTPA